MITIATGLIDIMKRASLEAMNDSQYADLKLGSVIQVNPLKVQITTQFILPESVLIVPQHLTDYSVDVTVNWTSEEAGSHSHQYNGTTSKTEGGEAETSFESHDHTYSGNTIDAGNHSHDISGKKTITIHNALKVGDRVALLRKHGGQSFLILDRI